MNNIDITTVDAKVLNKKIITVNDLKTAITVKNKQIGRI